jgi:hypothetical protein
MTSLGVDLQVEWPPGIPSETRRNVDAIVTWLVEHEPSWYPRPGRTLFVPFGPCGRTLKIKGAGFYNPSNVSSSGLRRTVTPVPEGPLPMPPLQQAFRRDLIHVDPSEDAPHLMEAVRSIDAPVGGMTLDAAMNDQKMFTRLTSAGLPSNRALVSYRYRSLRLEGRDMGVSVSEYPSNALPITPYEIYLAWRNPIDADSVAFLTAYTKKAGFAISDPSHRLEAIASLARVAGGLIVQFSSKAGLYRFSGSPDNWNIRSESDSPCFFSDVDTSRVLSVVPTPQWGWEVLRNLLTSIHQWFYYFIPCLTYEESGYLVAHLEDEANDFVQAMLSGFFEGADERILISTVRKIWRFLEAPLRSLERGSRIPLRSGEYVLETHYPRPIFYFVILSLLADLIQGSKVQMSFPQSDTTVDGIRRYVAMSSRHPSHSSLFSGYSVPRVQALIAEAGAEL